MKKTVSKAKKAVKSAAKKVEKAVKKTAAKVVKKAKTVVKKAVKKAKTVVRKAKKTVKKVVRKAAKKVKSSKLYKKAKKTATKIKKKVCTTAKRIQKATVSFVKNVDWKKVVAGTVAAVAIAGAVALTGGAAMPVLIGAAQAGGMGALVSGAAAAAQGGSIADIAKAASDGFLWGAIGGAIAGGTAVMFNQAATTGSSLAGNYAVRQAVDVGTDTVLDTVQAVARGEDVNAKTIGRDLLANTLMDGAQVAGGSGKNGIVDGSQDATGSHNIFKMEGRGAGGANSTRSSINAEDLNYSNSARHVDRPYQDSTQLMQEIMDSQVPTVDPRGSAGLYWKVDGTFNGTSGQYELLISPDGKTIWHYLFKGN